MNLDKAMEFLDECNEDIDDFPNKLKGFLRTATICNLKNPVNGGLEESDANEVISTWLSKQNHGE